MTTYGTYNAASLRRILDEFERCYGMSSEDFMRAHVEDGWVGFVGIPGFARHTWASFYREWQTLS